jgi:hypothetical protein
VKNRIKAALAITDFSSYIYFQIGVCLPSVRLSLSLLDDGEITNPERRLDKRKNSWMCFCPKAVELWDNM